MADDIERRRSVVDRIDNWLLVIGGVIAVYVVFQVIGWIMSAVYMLLRFAVAVVIVVVVVGLLSRRRGSD